MGRTSTLALAIGLAATVGMATPAAAQKGHNGRGHGGEHGHGHAAKVHDRDPAVRRSVVVVAPQRRVSDVRYSTRTTQRTGMSDVVRRRMGVPQTRTYDRRIYERHRVYTRRDYDRDRYYDRRDYDRDRDRYVRRAAYDSYIRQGKGGPKFCRTGAGHPVHGRAWCIQKGFGLGGGSRWDRVNWGDAYLRNGRTSGSVGRVGLSDIVGSMMYGRLDARRRTYGYNAPLSGRWFRTESGAPALLVSAGTQALAELIDSNRDGRADLVLLRRR